MNVDARQFELNDSDVTKTKGSLFDRLAILVYYAGVLFNRVVPEAVFRCRFVRVFQLKSTGDTHCPASEHAVRDGVQVRMVQEQEIAELARVTGNALPVNLIKNHRAVGVFDQGELCGGFWAAHQDFTEMELGIRYLLEPNQAWGYSAYIDKSVRGQGLYQQTLAVWCSELTTAGFPVQLVAVNPWNRISLNAHRKNASDCVACIFTIRLFHWAYCWTAGKVTQQRRLSFDTSQHPIEIRFDGCESLGGVHSSSN